MPSLKSQLINTLIRNRHLLQGKLRKPVFDVNTSIQKFRQQCEKSAARMSKIPDDVKIREEVIDGIKSEWIIPAGSHPQKVILYVHGGGYVSGSCSDHRGFVSTFARDCGFTCLVYEYRLAPENPFPAAMDDSLKVYEWLLSKGYLPCNILFTGESAGGGLCLALLLALKQSHIPLPAAAVAISPWTDLTCSSESYITKNKVSVAPKNSWTVFSRYYSGDHRADDPLISPLFGELRGLPPVFINSGTDDELFEDGEKFYLKALEADVNIRFRAGISQVHCYPFFSSIFKEATDAMNEIMDFIRQHLNDPAS